MTDRIVVILSSADIGKVRTGAMYAVNALKHGWMEEVKVFLFGPAEQLLLQDEQLQNYLREYQAMEETVIACKFVAQQEAIVDEIEKLAIRVDYVGSKISDLIRQGYVPMVW